MTRRRLLGATAGAAVATGLGSLATATPAAAARTKNLFLSGQTGNLSLITPAGEMLMYYHNEWQYGGPSIIGPQPRGSGWNRYGLIATSGMYGSYDNLYIGLASDGVYAYYWSQGENRWRNDGAPVWTAPRTGSWANTRLFFGGGTNQGNANSGGTYFYTIDTAGTLYRHIYEGLPGEGGQWSRDSGTRIGVGWDFTYVTADTLNVFWGVKPNGDLYWYRYSGPTNGDITGWQGGTVVGTGWLGGTYGYQTVQSAGAGGLYMIDRNGDLRWNKELNYWVGEPTWQYPTGGGRILGPGWM
ncbi:tachylectin-related carbohydrate-binding protein [Actinoplanes oblitus]|uniref:Tachylectin-related carbohydrate-binding protein n=1 Tax=Actinoplanes oblitus TaxID=3040509 RepID=A0ABY8WUY5_9ACTN|nr:tachylectin-related carbohydrate-binding protein [Actinoplanes oblitus]WIN00260.1 tachylectin-related carbohydrate-binding protein [Actinoplanes oblitus]